MTIIPSASSDPDLVLLYLVLQSTYNCDEIALSYASDTFLGLCLTPKICLYIDIGIPVFGI